MKDDEAVMQASMLKSPLEFEAVQKTCKKWSTICVTMSYKFVNFIILNCCFKFLPSLEYFYDEALHTSCSSARLCLKLL
jgi:hypothetical protein